MEETGKIMKYLTILAVSLVIAVLSFFLGARLEEKAIKESGHNVRIFAGMKDLAGLRLEHKRIAGESQKAFTCLQRLHEMQYKYQQAMKQKQQALEEVILIMTAGCPIGDLPSDLREFVEGLKSQRESRIPSIASN
jgi:hypothetical protein